MPVDKVQQRASSAEEIVRGRSSSKRPARQEAAEPPEVSGPAPLRTPVGAEAAAPAQRHRQANARLRARLSMMKVGAPLMEAVIQHKAAHERRLSDVPADSDIESLERLARDMDAAQGRQAAPDGAAVPSAAESEAELLGRLLEKSCSLGDRLAAGIGLTPEMLVASPWMRRVAVQIASGQLAKFWSTTGSMEMDTVLDRMIEVMNIRADLQDVSDALPNVPEPDMEVAFRLAVADCVANISREIDIFAFRHDRSQLLDQVVNLVMDFARRLTVRLAPADISAAGRMTLMRGLTARVTDIYCSSHRREGKALIEQIRTMAADERLDFIRDHPNGFPMDDVLRDFALRVGYFASAVSRVERPDFGGMQFMPETEQP